MALLVSLFRSGIQTPVQLPLACLVIAAGVALGPSMVPDGRLRSWEPTGWPAACISLILLAALPLALWSGPALLPLYGLAAVVGGARALPRLRAIQPAELGFLLVGPGVLALYLFVEVHGSFFAVALAPEMAALGGLSADTLFHASIAHMIQNFGVASTGLDGLVPITYHVGSHAWLAGLGSAAHVPPLFAYPYGQLVVALPTLVFATFLATRAAGGTRSGLLASLLAATGVMVLADLIGWRAHYTSESQTFGLILVLLALPALLHLLREPPRSRWTAAALLGAVLLAVCTKLSAGALLGAAVGWVALRSFGWGPRLLAVAAGLVAIALYALAEIASGPGVSFSLLHFYRSPAPPGLERLPSYTTPLVPLLAVGALLFAQRGESQRPARETRLRIELVMILTLLGLVPAWLLAIPSPLPWWFTNVAQWAALPLLAATLADPRTWRARARRARLVLATLVASGFAVWTATGGPGRFDRAYRPIFLQAGLIEAEQAEDRRWATLALLASRATRWEPLFPAGVQADRSRGALVRSAIDRGLGNTARDDVLVFVPPTNRDVWTLYADVDCYRAPLRIPALTGLPLLQGLPPGCPPLEGIYAWGFEDYGEDARSAPSTPASLCRRARRRGFERVFVLRSIRAPRENQLLNCGG